MDKKILKLVFQKRGSVKITARVIRKLIPEARSVSVRLLQRRLEDAGLAWLRRRRKTLVPAQHKEVRVEFAKWVIRRTSAILKRWAYTDGCTKNTNSFGTRFLGSCYESSKNLAL